MIRQAFMILLMSSGPAGTAQGSSLLVAGTMPRPEIETKLAYETEGLDRFALRRVVEAAMRSFGEGEDFSLPHVLGRAYNVGTALQAFVFQDTYFDTADHDLLKNHAGYRLRYRWSTERNYYFNQMVPALTAFYPTRCEIQLKTDYQADPETQVMTATETRFEFRKESEPFRSYKLAPPPPPWPFETFAGYAKDGVYDRFTMRPYHELKKLMTSIGKAPSNLQTLRPVVRMTTTRDRLHLSIKNPWGSGPNPEQSFIVSLDSVDATVIATNETVTFFELEVEIDRNILTELEKLASRSNEEQFDEDLVILEAASLSTTAINALRQDQQTIKSRVVMAIARELGLSPSPVVNKYQRIMQATKQAGI